MISTDDDIWAETMPVNISGHYHRPDQPFLNLYYAGSLMQTCHGEEGQTKRLLRIELDDEIKITEIVLKRQVVYETITVDILLPLDGLEPNPKHRYILTNGTSAELLAFHQQNKKIFGDRVSYRAKSSEIAITTTEKVDSIKELREAVPAELKDLLDSYLQTQEIINNQSSIQLPMPKRCLKLKISRFMCFEDRVFKLYPGINKLVGENGSGKTTMMKAVEYCLYGGNAPAFSEKKQKVEVILEARKQWTICRSSNPRSLVLILGTETYKDESAQAIIDASMGKQAIWKATSQLEQKASCSFFAASDKEKRELLSLIFNEEESMIELGRKLTDDEGKLKKERDLTLRSLEEFQETIKDFVEKPEKPDFSDLTEPEKEDEIEMSKEPTFNDLEPLEDLEKPKLPEEPKKLTQPENVSLCEKEIAKLNKEMVEAGIALKNRETVKENEEKTEGLKRELPKGEELKTAREIIKLVQEVQGETKPITKEELEILRRQWENWEKVSSYQKEFKRTPTKERIDILREGIPADCPSCQAQLLIEDKKLNLRPANWESNPNSLREKKLLSAIDFNLTKPVEELEDAEERKQKFEKQQTLKKYSKEQIENAEKIIKKFKDVNNEISALEKFNEKLETDERFRSIDKISKEIDQWNQKKQLALKSSQEYQIYLNEKEKYDELKEKILFDYQQELKELEKRRTEKQKRIKDYQRERERVENERKKQLERYNEKLAWLIKEKERRQAEWEKKIEKWKKMKEKKKSLNNQAETVSSLWAETKELLRIFRTVQSQIFDRKITNWNLIFEELLKRCFESISAQIVPYKESKTGTIERIGFEIVLDEIKRKDVKSLSGGENDIFSLVFLLSCQRLLSTNFKLMLFDESLSQISQKNIHDRIVNVLEDYLTFPGTFCLISSHDDQLFNDTFEICL